MTNALPRRVTTVAPGLRFSDLRELRIFTAAPFYRQSGNVDNVAAIPASTGGEERCSSRR